MKQLHQLLLALALLTPASAQLQTENSKLKTGGSSAAPNLVVFLSDDQGWGDLSHSGNTDLATPNIDSLAKDGASFGRFYVCPVCSPTRAEFLTGRHHARSGVYSTSAGGERMDLDETTIADLFKKAGYATGAFGKWHNGMQFPYHPNGRGFDTFYGFCSGHWGNYFSPFLEQDGQIVKGDGFCIDDFTDKAMAFIEKNAQAGQPFFAYLPYNTPHSPMQVPDPYWDKFAERPLQSNAGFLAASEKKGKGANHLRCALAMCENLDHNVGRVLDKLDTLGVAADTIVVWFHDNGPNGSRWNGGMKGRKGSTDEGGVRSPLFVRWPAAIDPGTQIPQIASARDLLPTLCDLAGITPGTANPLDGLSVKPLLLDPTSSWPHQDRILINHWKDKVAARTQTHRLDHTGKLYHMVDDPGQAQFIKDKPIFEKLNAALQAYKAEHLPTYGQEHDKRPFVIAHPGSPHTQLPARDGIPHGNIQRSNKFPNDSYFHTWTSTDDKITWSAEVAQSGTYAVTLYYASKSAGAKCHLTFGNNTLDFQIPEAHDVPPLGADDDRSARSESYTKDWKPIEIGQIQLEEGAGELVLTASEIPGDEAMEFRLFTLERIK